MRRKDLITAAFIPVAMATMISMAFATPFMEAHYAKYTETDWGSSVTAEIWASHAWYNPYVFRSAKHKGTSDSWGGVWYASDLFMYCETDDYYYSVITPGSSVVSYGPEQYCKWARTTVERKFQHWIGLSWWITAWVTVYPGPPYY